MTPEERAAGFDSDPALDRALASLPRLVKNRDMSRTTKLVIMLKVADEVGKIIAPHTICSSGCSHCCKMAVPICDLEAKIIGEAIGRERAPVARKVPDHVASIEQETQAAKWKGVPCTFLGDDGRCTIYEHRPLACRIHFSLHDTPDPCDIVNKPGEKVAGPDLRAFPMACAWILHGTGYADIREFFPRGTA